MARPRVLEKGVLNFAEADHQAPRERFRAMPILKMVSTRA